MFRSLQSDVWVSCASDVSCVILYVGLDMMYAYNHPRFRIYGCYADAYALLRASRLTMGQRSIRLVGRAQPVLLPWSEISISGTTLCLQCGSALFTRRMYPLFYIDVRLKSYDSLAIKHRAALQASPIQASLTAACRRCVRCICNGIGSSWMQTYAGVCLIFLYDILIVHSCMLSHTHMYVSGDLIWNVIGHFM